MNLANLHSIYFVGIGGIGMSAQARWFNQLGYTVSGYDRTSTTLTAALEKEGIYVEYKDAIETLPEKVVESPKEVLVIYTPAIPDNNQILTFFRNGPYEILKRAEVLGKISENHYTIAVAGTHGKTTTSTMIAHLLFATNRNVTAFLGGISTNYNTNILINKTGAEEQMMVVEADEYDRSFLTLHPDYAIITSVDADHLDIYKDKNNLTDSFKKFAEQISINGTLLMNENINSVYIDRRQKQYYGLEKGDAAAKNIRIEDAYFTFDYADREFTIPDLKLLQPGYHNIENAVAAIKTCLDQGLSIEEVRKGISSYLGVKRRFEYIIKSDKLIYIDDYAHHPVEITAFLKSLKSMYPNRKITAVFQPHLYSRTADFAFDFGTSLSLADEVILLEIYPAREKPIAGVTSQLILDNILVSDKSICPKSKIVSLLNRNDLDVFVTMGAGDIDQLVEPIKQKLTA